MSLLDFASPHQASPPWSVTPTKEATTHLLDKEDNEVRDIAEIMCAFLPDPGVKEPAACILVVFGGKMGLLAPFYDDKDYSKDEDCDGQ